MDGLYDYDPRMYNNDMILDDALAGELEEGERVEADDGYKNHAPEHVRCPACIANPTEFKKMQLRVRGRHETGNRRFKQWEILRGEYCHDIEEHGSVFCAIVVLTQLAFESGEPLFQVEYD